MQTKTYINNLLAAPFSFFLGALITLLHCTLGKVRKLPSHQRNPKRGFLLFQLNTNTPQCTSNTLYFHPANVIRMQSGKTSS